MKKILSLFVLLIAFQVQAQEFHVIPKIGLNLSNVTNGGNVKPGMNIGVSGEILFTDAIAFEPGLFFSMQGAKSDDMNVLGMNITDIKLMANYINIPLLVKGYVYEGFHLYAGPQIGILASSKIKMKSSGTSISEDADGALNSVGMDLILGAGYLFDSGFNISFNYNIGLTNINSEDTGKSRNMVAQINVGYRF